MPWQLWSPLHVDLMNESDPEIGWGGDDGAEKNK